MKDPRERALFGALRCMCGGCPRDLLSTCGCSAGPRNAEETRAALREKMAQGETNEQIIEEYRQQYGVEALAIPPNTGALRAIYVAPLVAIFGGAVALGVTVARWRARGVKGKMALDEAAARAAGGAPKARDEYDARLDEELKDLDG
jgi:cytochrome c-type biogenesis protein CcmH/NrfF